LSGEAQRGPDNSATPDRHGRNPGSQSLLRRVALGAAASAMFAALIAASVTSVFAAYLTRRAHDRRVQDAALVLAAELDDDLSGRHTLVEIVGGRGARNPPHWCGVCHLQS
jgi:hypothetical protein